MDDRLVLFVCSGNVCRSPMAEYLLRARLGSGTRWLVRSAGVSAAPGLPASEGAVRVLQEQAVDLRGHSSRPLTPDLVEAAFLIVVMTAAQRETVVHRFPMAADKVYVLNEFAPGAPATDVQDPIGSVVPVYREVRDTIDRALPGLAGFLERMATTGDAEQRDGQ